MCPHCTSFAVGTVESPGVGTVHSWTVTHHVFDPSVTTDVPYALVTIDLAEGVRVLGRLNGEGRGLRPGLPVVVQFTPSESGTPVLMVRPVPDGAAPDPTADPG